MLKSKIILRDYQTDLVGRTLKQREGVLVAGTGAGKTICGVEIIARLGLTTTILCHTKTIASQWKEEIEKYLDIKPKVINAGNKEIGPITIATIQSLQADPELCKKLAEQTSVLITDECHLFVSDKRQATLRMFKPKYMYGLTGTPKKDKDDGRTDVIFFTFGEKTCEFYMEQMKPTIDVVRSNENIPVDEYHEIVSNMVENDSRNTLISGIALGECMTGRKVLILTKRIAHAELLYAKFPSHWQNSAVFLISSTDKERDNVLSQFKASGAFSVIIGTMSLLGTGVNVPQLDTIILAADLKSEILTEQSIGRILRLFEGKKDPLIYDIWDNRNPILSRQFFSRKSFYSRKNWTIKGL